MLFDFLPKEIEQIIINYSNQLEHYEKFSKCLFKIKEIDYEIYTPLTELCLEDIREHIEWWRNMDMIDNQNIYPVPLQYFFKNKSFRIIGKLKYKFYYHYDSLMCEKFDKNTRLRIIFPVENKEKFLKQ